MSNDKVIAKFWISEHRDEKGERVPGYYEEEKATILHWGISYEELRDGVSQYTVVFVMLEDGTVHELHPSRIRFELNKQ